MEKPLEKEFRFFMSHHDELVKNHLNRFVVVKGEKVIGVYDDEIEAIRETEKDHQVGTFLVEKCQPGAETFTRVFHSRVALI